MRKWLFVLLLCGLPFGLQADNKPRDPYTYFFDESFWNLAEELETVREKGKKGILMMFEMDECPFCHRMKTTILNQPEVQDYFKKHFLILPIDIEGDVELVNFKGEDTTMKDFAFKEYRVRATPVFAFFDANGQYIKQARYTGATRNKEEFLLLGRFVVEGEYKKQSFARYKRVQR